MTILRKLNKRAFAVLHDGRERARFAAAGKPEINEQQALDWAQRYLSPTNSLERDTVLFMSRAQTVCWITDAGDNFEPAELGGNSLIRIADDTSREIICTGEELHLLAQGILNLNLKISKSAKP